MENEEVRKKHMRESIYSKRISEKDIRKKTTLTESRVIHIYATL